MNEMLKKRSERLEDDDDGDTAVRDTFIFYNNFSSNYYECIVPSSLLPKYTHQE